MTRPLLRSLLRSLAVLLCLGFAFAKPAQALCLPAVCSCTTVTTNVAFGSYAPMAFGNTNTTGTIKVTCGGVVGLLIPYNIALSAGSSGSFTNRQMKSGSNVLSYNLYTDSSYATVWGDGTSSTQVVSSSVTLDALGLSPGQTFYVYGSIPGRQTTAVPGTYADTIGVTVTYY